MTTKWQGDEVLAWTERDGPGRPPGGPPRLLSLSLGLAMAAVFVGMLSTDTLCPEHRAWVQLLGSVALLSIGCAVVGLVRDWAVAAPLALLSAALGVWIGIVDAAHSATRGTLIAVCFGMLALGAFLLTLGQVRLARWDRQVLADPVPAAASAPEVELEVDAPRTRAQASSADV